MIGVVALNVTLCFLQDFKQLQAIQAEYNPSGYTFLTVTPPTDIGSLTTLLTSLLQKLDRSDAAADDTRKVARSSPRIPT